MASASPFQRLQHRFKRRRFHGAVKAHLRLLPLAAVLMLLALPGALADEGPGPHVWLAGSYDTSGYAYGVAVAGGYTYVTDGNDGLVILGQTSPWWQTPLILVALGISAYSASFSFLTRRAFRGTEQALEEWESAGVNTSSARKLLDEGRQKWERFNHPAAMVLAKQAKEKGEEHARGHENIKRIVNQVEEKLQGYEAEGVQVGPARDLLEQARSAWDEMDFQKAEELARQAEADGTVRESQYRAVEEKMTELKAKITEFKEKGVNTDELEKILKQAEEGVKK